MLRSDWGLIATMKGNGRRVRYPSGQCFSSGRKEGRKGGREGGREGGR
jgi:hypothetical protein